MKKNDKWLIFIVLVIGVVGYAVVQILQSALTDENATAVVTYESQEILHISLADGSYTIIDDQYIYRPDENEDNPYYIQCFAEDTVTCVTGENGPVVIEYNNHMVDVIYETSPNNTCRLHGPTNSPVQPITCLPNRISIRIVSSDSEDDAYIRRRESWTLYKTLSPN
jgi:hypothetical protein